MKKKNQPSPEERKRIVDDAMRMAGFKLNPSETLVQKLDDMTIRIRSRFIPEIAERGFIDNEEALMNRIAQAYMDEFTAFTAEETKLLFASFLSANAIEHLRP